MLRDIGKKSVLILLATVFVVSFGAAQDLDWHVDSVDEPFSMNTTGVNTTTYQFVRVTYDDNAENKQPMTPSDLNESNQDNLDYFYNTTSNSTDLQHYYEGYWYANFMPNLTQGDMIKYNASGETEAGTSSNGVANLTEDLNVGNFTVELRSSVPSEVKAGNTVKIEAKVENATSDSYINETNGSVEVFFANDSYQSTVYNLDNYNDENNYFFNSEVYYPETTESNYVMTLNASSSESGYHGTKSVLLETKPALQAYISKFDAVGQGCDTDQNVQNCEPGANITMHYNVSNSDATDGELEIQAYNSSGRHVIESMSLSESGGNFTGEVEVPDINTSMYDKELRFEFNVSNNNRVHIDSKNVTVHTFDFQDRSSPTTYLGEDYGLDLFLGKPYSLESYSKDRFTQINITVDDSEGSEIANFSKGDLGYDSSSGLMEVSTVIEPTAETGTYTLDVNVTDTYGENKQFDSGFQVRGIDQTFNVEDSVDWPINRLEPYTFHLGIENYVDAENTLNYTVNGIDDVIDVKNSSSFTLSGGENTSLEVEANLTELEDREGSIMFEDTDTGYNETTEVLLDAADCEISAGDLCSESRSGETFQASSTENITETIDLRYIGPTDGNLTYNTSVDGDISPFMDVEGVENESVIDSEKEVEVVYMPSSSGEYTGQIVFETESDEEIELDRTLDVSLDSSEDDDGSNNEDDESSGGDLDVTLQNSEVSLGAVIGLEDSSGSATVTVENTGTADITSVSTFSDAYQVSPGDGGALSISEGETGDVQLNFESVSSESGSVTLTFDSSDQQVDRSVSVTASASSITSDVESLRSTLRNLESSQGNMTELTQASQKIDTIQTAWDSGEYDRASRLYSEVQNTFETVRNTQGGGDTGDKGSENTGSGIPILPIAAGVILLILIGFVFFTSYVPEEGDPLYDVLGEE